MNIAQLFQICHGAVNKKDWIPFDALSEEQLLTIFHTEEEQKEVLERLGAETFDHFYYDPTPTLYPVLFYNQYFYYAFSGGLSPVYLDMTLADQYFAQMKKRCEQLYQEKDFETLFFYLDKRVLLFAFQDLYAEIPDEQKYDLFTDIYTRSEYGFRDLDPDILDDIFSHRHHSERWRPFQEIQEESIDKDGYVAIYRGVASQSAPLNKAYSWSLDYDKALFFATRFFESGSRGYVLQAQVHHQDILDYLNNRGEKEVLVRPASVREVKKYKKIGYTLKSALGLIKPILGEVEAYTDQVDPDWFHRPHGIHGVSHTIRVLMHTAFLSQMLQLSPEDRTLLFRAAIYHDIGRTHDGEDEEHGFESVKKMKHLRIWRSNLTAEDQIVKFMIEWHCINDEDGLEFLKNTKLIQDKSRAEKLYQLFKDADGLDRVRLGDLDIRYLRTKQAKELVGVAQELFDGDE